MILVLFVLLLVLGGLGAALQGLLWVCVVVVVLAALVGAAGWWLG